MLVEQAAWGRDGKQEWKCSKNMWMWYLGHDLVVNMAVLGQWLD